MWVIATVINNISKVYASEALLWAKWKDSRDDLKINLVRNEVWVRHFMTQDSKLIIPEAENLCK